MEISIDSYLPIDNQRSFGRSGFYHAVRILISIASLSHSIYKSLSLAPMELELRTLSLLGPLELLLEHSQVFLKSIGVLKKTSQCLLPNETGYSYVYISISQHCQFNNSNNFKYIVFLNICDYGFICRNVLWV
jgi:hypothetical protein